MFSPSGGRSGASEAPGTAATRGPGSGGGAARKKDGRAPGKRVPGARCHSFFNVLAAKSGMGPGGAAPAGQPRLHISGVGEKPSGRSYSRHSLSPRCFTLKPFALYSS